MLKINVYVRHRYMYVRVSSVGTERLEAIHWVYLKYLALRLTIVLLANNEETRFNSKPKLNIWVIYAV